MALKRAHPARTAPAVQPSSAQITRQNDGISEFRTRRLKRRLDELERTNPTDIPASSFVPTATTSNGAGSGMGMSMGGTTKKKMSSNVRRIVLARKSLKDWLDELPKDPTPPYILAAAPPPSTPDRKLCSSCGYVGSYKCEKCGEWSCGIECAGIHLRDGGCGVGN